MKRCLVLGAGVSGQAAARIGAGLGWKIRVYDAQPEAVASANGRLDWNPVTGPWRRALVSDCDLVVTSPGFAEDSLPIRDALEAGKPVWSEVELAGRELSTEMIAITGTNGKTTVALLVADMLARSGMPTPVVGNIGDPLSDLVGENQERAVVELSSFQLRFTETLAPATAVITNVASDHLDWHGTQDRYLAAKARIHMNQGANHVLIIDGDDPGARRAAQGAKSRLQGVSVSTARAGSNREHGELAAEGIRIAIGDLAVQDPSYLADLLLAAAAARQWGATPTAVEEAILEFRPGPHRRRMVGEIGGVRFVDDSKATNPHAALASINAFGSVVLIAGGLSKGLDLSPLTTASQVRAVVAIGEATTQLLQAAPSGVATSALSMPEAVETARGLARPGDVVLLAPGCASFDQFESYEDRGRQFAQVVAAVATEGDRSP